MSKKAATRPVKGNLVRIGQLARAAGVSTPTVHYYLKEGLLTPPVITSRNMSYYDPGSVEEIKLIKDLQAKRYLPLSVIRLLLQSRRKGEAPGHILEMDTIMSEVFRPIDSAGGKKLMSLPALAEKSGLPLGSLKTIQSWGLISPVPDGARNQYDDISLRVAGAVNDLLKLGLELEDLQVFGSYVEAMRSIAGIVHRRVHELHDRGTVRLVDLATALENLKKLLAIGVSRQMFSRRHDRAAV